MHKKKLEWLKQLTVGQEVAIRETTEEITATVNYTKATILEITDEKILVKKLHLLWRRYVSSGK